MRASPFEKVFHRLPCVSYICTYPTVIVRTLYIFSLSFLLFFYFSPSAIPPLPLSLLFISRLYFSLSRRRIPSHPSRRRERERERERIFVVDGLTIVCCLENDFVQSPLPFFFYSYSYSRSNTLLFSTEL